jgi:rod shape-determining protein MreC
MGIESIFHIKGPFTIIMNYTVVPLEKGISYTGGFARDFTDNFQTISELQKENKELTSKYNTLKEENTRLQQNEYELKRLQNLFKLDQNYSDYPKIGARVIANSGSNWFNNFTIDKGTKDGLKVGCNVIAGDGLVGIITEIGPNYAKVRSIIDDNSNISGMVLTTSDTLIVEGNLKLFSKGILKFDQLKNNDNKINSGEQIVTSGISDKFLQGILIGYVKNVKVDSTKLARTGELVPAVDFSKLQEVLVITKTKQDLLDENISK